ncbi:MAG: hypothetical protein JSS27_14645 [Planctomycetes bacterium]|nr:hypothetical protein [Planctomycetota bacterium]
MEPVRPLAMPTSSWLAWSVALVTSALAVWGWLRHSEPVPVVEPMERPATAVAQASNEQAQQEVSKADGEGMYVSPTAGPPLDLKYLARGTQGVIALRPAELVLHPEGRKLLDPDVTGYFARWMRYALPKETGTTLGNIELLLIGSKWNDSHYCKVLYFRDPVPISHLIANKEWHAQTVEIEGQTILRDQNRGSYWQPPGENGRVLVIAKFEALPDLIRGKPADLPPATLALLKQSDANRHFTMAAAPYFALNNSGLFNRTANYLFNPVAWFLTGFAGDLPSHVPARDALESVPAVLFSGHLDDERSFAELLIAQADARADHLEAAQPFVDRINRLDQLANRYIQKLDEGPLGRNLSLIYPDMVRALRKYTRVGAADGRIVIRSYLPVEAPRNLLVGARLCLGERPMPWESPNPNSLEARLNRLITFEVGFGTLEQAIRMLSEELDFPITIREQDLQVQERITSIKRFHEHKAPARKILVEILKEYSPDGKLVFIIKSTPDGSQEVVITTRAAVFKNQENLPTEFGGVTELLARRTTLSFPRNSLEKALEMLSENTNIPITMREQDLQLEGITRGSSFGIHEVDKPAREIIRALLERSSRKDKAVFVIRRKPDGSGEEVVITTRAAVIKNGEQLPPEFAK